MKIGEKYVIPAGKGDEIVAELFDCFVSASDKTVTCIYRLPNSRDIICRDVLTEKEFLAYKRHPDTFFGKYRKQNHQTKDALDLYDFFYNAYNSTSKKKLLEFMRDSKKYEKMKEMSQGELAKVYCEGLVYSVIKKNMIE